METVQTSEQAREQAIREHYPMPADIRAHASSANFDLYFGPLGFDHWRVESGNDSLPDYDWCESRDIFHEWLADLDTVYYEPDTGCILESEPEGEWYHAELDEYSSEWQEESEGWQYYEPEPYYSIDSAEIAEAFGYSELYRS